MRRLKTVVAASALALVAAGSSGSAAARPAAPDGISSRPVGVVAPAVDVSLVTSGLASPTDVVSPPGSTDLYIAEKCGVIRVFTGGELKRVGSLAGRVDCDGERGLLSLAFHPDFATTGWLFAYYTRKDTGDIQLARVKVAGKRLVAGSYRALLRIRHRQALNHNGGKLAFDGSGNLFISTGDGGGGGNQFGHSQDHKSLLGKILRIDVDHGLPYTIPEGNPLGGRKGRAEIWGIGLRNPWRMSYDAGTNSLWIGDVGQDTVEEIDKVAASSGRLRNFGWSRYEGRRVFDSSERLRGGRLVKPVKTYRHPVGESIIGGAVYRGTEFPDLKGYYVYGDLNGWIAGFKVNNPDITFKFTPTDFLLSISQAANGELYAAYGNGDVYHVVVPSS